MSKITSQQESIALNQVLPRLLSIGKFNIADVHFKILQETFTNSEGIVDLDRANEVYASYFNTGTYRNLTLFLTSNDFTEEIEGGYLLLTLKGQYLSAHGSLANYDNCVTTQLADQELKERTTLLLQQLTPFGEFCIDPNLRPNNNIIITTIPGQNEKEKLDYINAQLSKQREDYKAIVLKEHLELVKDERVVEYLVHNGFAINRYDIKRQDKLFRQLTDKGRNLKEKRTIDAYLSYEAECLKMEERQRVKDENLYWIQFWIAVGAVSAAAYYILEILRIQYHRGLPDHVFFR